MRVVIADDSLLVREGIASLLRRAGVEVVGEADDGEELLRVVDEHEPTPRSSTCGCRRPTPRRGSRRRSAIRDRHPGSGS